MSSARYTITHVTTYSGSKPVSVGYNEARLAPRACPRQNCHDHGLKISPAPSFRTSGADYFGNPFVSFSFGQGYEELKVTAKSDVSVMEFEMPGQSPAWEAVLDELRRHGSPEALAAYEFSFPSPLSDYFPELKQYTRESFGASRPIVDALRELTTRVHQDFVYDPRATTVTTAVADVFELRRGVCQDFAHLQISALRSLGLAARYVSGYLRTYPPPGKPRLVGADASHAWLAVYCGQTLGWVPVDPTNDRFVGADHITLAWGRDYSDVTPLKGVYTGGGKHTLRVSVDVAPQDEVE